jgi:hypothetical protein
MSDNTGQIAFAVLDGDQRATLHLTGSGLTSTPVTVSGNAGTMEQDTAVAADLGPVAGTVEVAYVFFAHGLTYRMAYLQAPSGPTSTDVRADFNLIIHNTLNLS